MMMKEAVMAGYGGDGGALLMKLWGCNYDGLYLGIGLGVWVGFRFRSLGIGWDFTF